MNWWLLWRVTAVAFLAFCASMVLWNLSGWPAAHAAPPPGGFAMEYVGEFDLPGENPKRIYRFRDGPRVCYVTVVLGYDAPIACVVSP